MKVTCIPRQLETFEIGDDLYIILLGSFAPTVEGMVLTNRDFCLRFLDGVKETAQKVRNLAIYSDSEKLIAALRHHGEVVIRAELER